MDKFQNKLNFNFGNNQQIIKKVSFIDSFRGKWNLVEQKENNYLKELRRIATIESIGSSTRIEGVQLTDNEIKELLEKIWDWWDEHGRNRERIAETISRLGLKDFLKAIDLKPMPQMVYHPRSNPFVFF